MSENRTLDQRTADLSRRLAQWRRTHRQRARIPAELWELAVDLAEEQGLYKTAHAVHLDYGDLKKRMEMRSRKAAPTAAKFVECLLPVSRLIAECALEVEASHGGKLRVAMKNVSPADVASILRDFTGAVTA